MNEPSRMKKIGATPAKLALVGVLAVVLLVVIVGQLPTSQAPSEIASRQTTQSNEQSKRPKLAQTKKQTEGSLEKTKAAPRVWTEMTVESIVAFDPLAKPDWLITAEASLVDGSEGIFSDKSQREAKKAAVLKQLMQEGTKIVVISSGEKRATLGEQQVRIGDQFEGFEITDITKQGVVLSELEQR